MLTTILFFRGIAFAALFLMLLSVFRVDRSKSKNAFILLCIGLMAYVVEPILESVPLLQIPVIVMAITVPLVFWWFCLQLFQDNNHLAGTNQILVQIIVASYLVFSYSHFALDLANPDVGYPTLFYVSYSLRIGFIAAAIYVVFSHWKIDLIAERRSFRGLLVGLSGLYILGVLLVELGLATMAAPIWLESVHAVGLAATFLVLASWLLISEPSALFPNENSQPDRKADSSPSNLSYQELKWMERLNSLLEEQKIYRENGLSIGSLAARLDAPEHRLRRLINTQLGYRNFNDFLNHYRLKDAAAILQDPTQSALPILTVALECGFSSINPFNRAFKSQLKCTPSEFRAKSLNR